MNWLVRSKMLVVLALVVTGLAGPAHGKTSQENNNFYTEGMPNGHMWAGLSELGDKPARFFRAGFVNGLASARALITLELAASGMDDRTIDKISPVLAGKVSMAKGECENYLDLFYSDTRNRQIPLGTAIFCIEEKLAGGGQAKYEALVTTFRDAYSK